MNLQSYIGKLVKLTLTNNKILIGKVIDFDDKVDNFDGYNSIEIDTGRITYDISENKIKTIVLPCICCTCK
ncbi:LSM domain protein [Staphylococcus aureus]